MRATFERPAMSQEPWWYQARLGPFAVLTDIPASQLADDFALCEQRLSPAFEAEMQVVFTGDAFRRLPLLKGLKRLFFRDPPAAMIALFHLARKCQDESWNPEIDPVTRAYLVDLAAPQIVRGLKKASEQTQYEQRPTSFDWAIARGVVLNKDWEVGLKSGDAVLSPDQSELFELNTLIESLAPLYERQVDEFTQRLLATLKQADPALLETFAAPIPELVALFDGVGGADGDRIASHVAAFAFGRWSAAWRDQPMSIARWQMLAAVIRTHQLLVDLGKTMQEGAKNRAANFDQLGTTALIAQLFPGNVALVMGIGDSLSYRFEQQTGLAHRLLPVLTRQYLGCGAPHLPLDFQIQRVPLSPGDRICFTSDGYEQLIPADIAANQVIAAWAKQQSLTHRLSSLSFFSELSVLLRGRVKYDDRSVAELAPPVSPSLQTHLQRDKDRLLADVGFLLPPISERVKWTVALKDNRVIWEVLRAFYQLKTHRDQRLQMLASGADASPRHLQEAIWRLGYAVETGRIKDAFVEQVLEEIMQIQK